MKVIENIWITLKDGTRLSSRIWFPQTDEKLPAILEYIPYRKMMVQEQEMNLCMAILQAMVMLL